MNENDAVLRDLSPQMPYGSSESVVEVGANSLKFHSLHSGYIHSVKYAYDLGHDVYRTGKVLPRTARRTVDIIRGHGIPSLAIATSAVRDAENSGGLCLRLRDELDLDLQILSCFEESSLLARAYLGRSNRLPALVVDIGGGSVEIVFLTRTKNILWDSLPIGAIRLYHGWKADGLSSMSDWIDRHLKNASIVTGDEIFATGGTVKAIAKTLKKTSFTHSDVHELEKRVRRDGPPPGLKPGRARVFFPGLILIRKLLEFVRAETLHHITISVGRRALEERLGKNIPSARSRYIRRSASSGN